MPKEIKYIDSQINEHTNAKCMKHLQNKYNDNLKNILSVKKNVKSYKTYPISDTKI